MQNYNSIGAEGAKHLAEPLGKLTSLTSLNLVRACGDMIMQTGPKFSEKGSEMAETSLHTIICFS